MTKIKDTNIDIRKNVSDCFNHREGAGADSGYMQLTKLMIERYGMSKYDSNAVADTIEEVIAQYIIDYSPTLNENSMSEYQEQTGRESMLEGEVAEMATQVDEAFRKNQSLEQRIKELEREVQRQQDLGQGYYDNMTRYYRELTELDRQFMELKQERNQSAMRVHELRRENDRLLEHKERLTGLEIQLREKIRTLQDIIKEIKG